MKNVSSVAQDFIRHGKSSTCPIIDMHGHYGPYGGIYFPGPYADGMLHSMDRAGVKTIVCSSHEAIMRDTCHGNSIIEELVNQYPKRFYGYWAVNPNYPETISGDLEAFETKEGFIGFKFLSDYHGCAITDDRYRTVLEYANERRLCILMHTWGYSPFDGPKLVRAIAEKYPSITIIMGHSGYGEWDEAIAVARDFENVFLELTAVYATHEGIELKWCPERDFGIGVNGVIERMAETAGSQKMLFGTDLPWYSPHYAAGAVIFARIGDEDMHNIFHRNAERILAKSRFKAFTHAMGNGEKIRLRLLEKEDEALLGHYFESLSQETRSFFGPHAFDRKAASEICSSIDNARIPRVIALKKGNGGDEIIAYTILLLGLRGSDRSRYLQHGIRLDESTDCTIAPSVSDKYQNLGLGKIIMGHAAVMARKCGKKRLVLWEGVQKRNTRAIRFYEKLGFKQRIEHEQSIDMVLTL